MNLLRREGNLQSFRMKSEAPVVGLGNLPMLSSTDGEGYGREAS